MKRWLKGLLLTGICILGPALWVPSVYGDWRPWYLFLLATVLIGTQPDVNYTKLKGEENAPEDRGSVVVILLAGYVTLLGPLYHFYGRAHGGAVISQAPKIAGLAALIGAFGLVLRIASIRILGQFFTAQVVVQDGHELCQRGPYRWIRHPSYTGNLIFYLSIPVVLQLWIWLPISVILWAVAYHQRISNEERALGNHFGEAYAEYKKRSWALIPYLY